MAGLMYTAGEEPQAAQSDQKQETEVVRRIQRFRLHVLVVDDEDSFRQALMTRLRSIYHAEVEGADASGVVFDRIATGYKFNLVLMDVTMPDVNGFQLREELLRQGFAGPIVLMSARPENRDAAGIRGVPFIDKFLNSPELEKVLISAGEAMS